eukprot:scaffold280_cov353-Prasinococcus_capsulatus_cf.AAC.1
MSGEVAAGRFDTLANPQLQGIKRGPRAKARPAQLPEFAPALHGHSGLGCPEADLKVVREQRVLIEEHVTGAVDGIATANVLCSSTFVTSSGMSFFVFLAATSLVSAEPSACDGVGASASGAVIPPPPPSSKLAPLPPRASDGGVCGAPLGPPRRLLYVARSARPTPRGRRNAREECMRRR